MAGLEMTDVQKLQSAEQMELLDVVDSLRACGLSEIVALPQLIVCGDQSSGKSSVLEAISGIPFPRQDSLCTRFATEVILRRATRDEISVSIVPGKDRMQDDRDRLLRFRQDLKTKDDFKNLFETARDAMGLSSASKSFSSDVLRVEFCGPSQPQLTLVDLPGLIHSETKSQTPGDVKLVHNLVSQYLENPRSIILAVVSAKNDIGNQIILHRARQVDEQGLRTLGIITKPDLLAKGSKSEEAFISLARNEDIKFALGWHMVKNVDSNAENDNPSSRDAQEALFFQDSSFNCLPAHTVGISFLRSRLSKVLFNQIRTELPRLVEDIQTQILSVKTARDKLGNSRAEFGEQQAFLISLSQLFQTICRDAARGDYEHEFFQVDSNPERRLCANVMNMHFEFAKNIRKNGAFWLVDDGKSDGERYLTRAEAIKQACVLLKKSRGRELPGLPNPLLVGELFRQYSRPWEELARLHIRKVWESTNKFLELLLRYLTDDEACENILQFWLNPLMEEKLNLAFGKLDELLEVHKDYPMTTNSHFVSSNRRPQPSSSRSQLEEAMKRSFLPGQKVNVEEISHLLSLMRTKDELDMDLLAAEEAFDNMNAYYEVAMDLFTDNVPTLAIQAPIIREIPNIFCPTTVFTMQPDLTRRIAGETDEKIAERELVLRKLKALESGAQICKQYAKRPQSFLNSVSEETGRSELPTIIRQTPKGNSKQTHPDSASHFPLSLSSKGVVENPFSHLSSTFPQVLSKSKSPEGAKSKAAGVGLFTTGLAPEGPDAKSGIFVFKDSNGMPIGGEGAKKEGSSVFGSVFASSPEKKPFAFLQASASNGQSSFGSSVGGFASNTTSDTKPLFGSGAESPAQAKTADATKLPLKNDIFNTVKSTATFGIKFKPVVLSGVNSIPNESNSLQSICCMEEFKDFSFEELRLADYRIMLNFPALARSN